MADKFPYNSSDTNLIDILDSKMVNDSDDKSPDDSFDTNLKNILDGNIIVDNSDSLDDSSSDTDVGAFKAYLARCRDIDSGWIDTVFNAIIDGRITVDKSKFTSYVLYLFP